MMIEEDSICADMSDDKAGGDVTRRGEPAINEFGIFEYLVKAQEWARMLGCGEKLIGEIGGKKAEIKDTRYRLAVMGEFNRGKSSLINALIGSDVLPTKMLATTAVVNRITFGVDKTAEIHYKNGGVECVGTGELSRYVTKLTEENEARAATIDEVVVYYPTEYGKNNIDIFDTPGLNDTDDMTAISERIARLCDTVLMPVSATSPFSETECRFVCSLIANPNICNVVFALTFIDQIGNDGEIDEQVDFVRKKIQKDVYGALGEDAALLEKAKRILDDIKLRGVSCSEAMRGIASNNEALIKKSRFEAFRAMLTETLIGDKRGVMIRRTAEYMTSLCEYFISSYDKRLKSREEDAAALYAGIKEVRAYSSDTAGCLDKMLARSADRVDELIKACYQMKNESARVYIDGLSGLKNDDGDNISRVLRECDKNAAGLIKRRAVPEGLAAIYGEVINKMNERRAAFCKKLASAHGGDMPKRPDGSPDISKAFAACVPRVSTTGAGGYDIIEEIIVIIDASVEEYIKALEESAVAARKELFRFYLKDAAEISDAFTAALNGKLKKNADERVAYLENYTKLLPHIKAAKKETSEMI